MCFYPICLLIECSTPLGSPIQIWRSFHKVFLFFPPCLKVQNHARWGPNDNWVGLWMFMVVIYLLYPIIYTIIVIINSDNYGLTIHIYHHIPIIRFHNTIASASVLTHPESAGDRTAGEKKSLELRITRAISGSMGGFRHWHFLMVPVRSTFRIIWYIYMCIHICIYIYVHIYIYIYIYIESNLKLYQRTLKC